MRSSSSGSSTDGPRSRSIVASTVRIATSYAACSSSSDRVAAHARGRDDARLRAQVVEDHERVGEDEQRVGNVDAARGRRGQALDDARDVVAEIADRATPELADLGQLDRLGVLEKRLEIGERIGRPTIVVPAALGRPVLHDAVRELPRGARRGPHERVARPRLAAGGRRLEQERERTVAQLGERGHRRLSVEQNVAPDGDEMRRPPVYRVGRARENPRRVIRVRPVAPIVTPRRYSPIMRQFLAARAPRAGYSYS